MRAVTRPSCQVCGERLTLGDPDTTCARCELIVHRRPRRTLLGWLRRLLGGR